MYYLDTTECYKDEFRRVFQNNPSRHALVEAQCKFWNEYGTHRHMILNIPPSLSTPTTSRQLNKRQYDYKLHGNSPFALFP